MQRLVSSILAGVTSGSLCAADVDFTQAAGLAGVQVQAPAYGQGTGVAAADFDDDGFIDLFIPQGEDSPDQLYRNLGDGSYEEIAAARGVADLQNNRSALWLDYDGDGDLDLLVGRDEYLGSADFADSHLTLYRQDESGQFEDVTVQAGLFGRFHPPVGGPAQMTSLSAADYNNDGFLDVLVCHWHGPLVLLQNNAGTTFSDVTATAFGTSDDELGHQAMWHDFDGDGWIDVFIAPDWDPNYLFMNQGDGTFIDVAAAAGVDTEKNEMGVTLGDYDQDGDFDIFVTNITREKDANLRNVFFRNDSMGGIPMFTEIAVDIGVAHGGWGWGATFMDADNDGWLDIAQTNGYWLPGFTDDPSKFFMHDPANPGTFIDASEDVGYDDTDWGSCVIAVDDDRDGDLDLLQTCMEAAPFRLLRNSISGPSADNHWLVVKPRMSDSPNTRAIGAVVTAFSNGVQRMRLISAGTSYIGQEPAEAFFGLGGIDVIEWLRVDFPDGRVAMRCNVSADQVLVLEPDEYQPCASCEEADMFNWQVLEGSVIQGDGASLTCSDDDALTIEGAPNKAGLKYLTRTTFKLTSPVTVGSRLDLVVETGCNDDLTGMPFQKLFLWNWNTASWTKVLQGSQAKPDTLYVALNVNNPDRFVHETTGEVRVRVFNVVPHHKAPNGLVNRIDDVRVMIAP